MTLQITMASIPKMVEIRYYKHNSYETRTNHHVQGPNPAVHNFVSKDTRQRSPEAKQKAYNQIASGAVERLCI